MKKMKNEKMKLRRRRKNIIMICIGVVFIALLYSFAYLRGNDNYEDIVAHFINYRVFEIGLFVLFAAYLFAFYKNEALKGAEKKSIFSETLHYALFFTAFFAGVFIPILDAEEIKTWIFVVVFTSAMTISSEVGGSASGGESKPFDLVALALLALMYYLLASLFSWSFNMENWKWFSKIVFWVSTFVIASMIIYPYRGEVENSDTKQSNEHVDDADF